MNKKVLTLILVIVTATSTNTMAQNIKKWSLRQCIDYAMDNNIQLQKSKISENVAETELKQAKAGLLPNLSGSMTQSLSHSKKAAAISLTVLLPQTAAIKPYKTEATA